MQSSFETYRYNLISDATFKMPHSLKTKEKPIFIDIYLRGMFNGISKKRATNRSFV